MPSRFAPLRISAYRKLLFSNVVTTLGFWFTYVAAFDLYVFDTEIGPLAVSFLGVSSVLPQVVGGPLAGVITDRYDRRTIIVVAYLLCVPLVLLLVVYRSLLLAYGAFLATGTLYSLSRPSYRSLIPQIVPDEQLELANGLLSSSDSTAQIVGPGIAGGILTVLDPQTLFVLDAATYFLAGVIVYTLSVEAVSKDDDGMVTAFRDGVSYLKRAPFVLSIVVLGGLVFGAIGTFEAIVPYFLREALGRGSSTYSFVLLMIGVGSFSGGITIGVLNDYVGARVVPGLGAVLLGVSLGAFTFVRAVPLLAAISGLVGVATVWFMSSAYTALHRDLADSYHGRVTGIFKSSTRGAQIVSMSVAGVLVSVAGTVTLFRAMAVLLVLGSIVWTVFIPQSDARADGTSYDGS